MENHHFWKITIFMENHHFWKITIYGKSPCLQVNSSYSCHVIRKLTVPLWKTHHEYRSCSERVSPLGFPHCFVNVYPRVSPNNWMMFSHSKLISIGFSHDFPIILATISSGFPMFFPFPYPKDPWCWNIYLHWDYAKNYFRGQCR